MTLKDENHYNNKKPDVLKLYQVNDKKNIIKHNNEQYRNENKDLKSEIEITFYMTGC